MPTLKAACFATFLAFLPAFTAARDATLGLKESHLDKNGIFVGTLASDAFLAHDPLSGLPDELFRIRFPPSVVRAHSLEITVDLSDTLALRRGEEKSPNTATSLNALLPEPMSSVSQTDSCCYCDTTLII